MRNLFAKIKKEIKFRIRVDEDLNRDSRIFPEPLFKEVESFEFNGDDSSGHEFIRFTSTTINMMENEITERHQELLGMMRTCIDEILDGEDEQDFELINPKDNPYQYLIIDPIYGDVIQVYFTDFYILLSATYLGL